MMDSDKEWIKTSNIYEVNLRQYTKEGSFNAFAEHLPRLNDMGIKVLWFMPLTPISEKNKKGSLGSYYACSDYQSINPEFGSSADLQSLVKKAHSLGFKVIIDWVANHTGWDHIWTIEHPDWYLKDRSTGEFKKASGMDDIIELDYSNPFMREAMINAMKFWILNYELDGFRCDLAFWVQLDFWQQSIPELNKIKPLFWLAELDPLEHPEYMQVFDAAYTWTWMHQSEAYYKNQQQTAGMLTDILKRYNMAPGINTWFSSNHDENSWNGTEYEKYGSMAPVLAVFNCTWRGLPLIYSGQELPNLKRLAFFEKDFIDWKPEISLHQFYRGLLQLHNTHPALHADASVRFLSQNKESQVIGYMRQSGESCLVVFLNFSEKRAEFELNENISLTLREHFTESIRDFSHERHFTMEAWSALIYL